MTELQPMSHILLKAGKAAQIHSLSMPKTLFFNGNIITAISETIYDYPDSSYATYSVTYHS
ncbi:MAG TPA: hypothetical protein VIK89_16940 [Cytophagaceae bacterium]